MGVIEPEADAVAAARAPEDAHALMHRLFESRLTFGERIVEVQEWGDALIAAASARTAGEERLRAALREGREMVEDAVELYIERGRHPAAELEWLEETRALAPEQEAK